MATPAIMARIPIDAAENMARPSIEPALETPDEEVAVDLAVPEELLVALVPEAAAEDLGVMLEAAALEAALLDAAGVTLG